MDEDKKVYSIIGQVTIGTDEYRDLIESVAKADRDKEYYRDRYWEEQRKTRELTEEVNALKDKLGLVTLFFAENSTAKDDFTNFKVRKQLEKDE